MRACQVHLDFHTSEFVPDVGKKFDKNNFQQALKLGNVDSITVFAKCHHSWCYYPSKIGKQHPTMETNFDLTGAMIDAAHEINVKAPIYITAGWSAQDANNHPEWVAKNKDGSLQNVRYDTHAQQQDSKPEVSWLNLCLAGGYAEHIYALTQEICERYDEIDGLFYDICLQGIDTGCYCDACKIGMEKMGLTIQNEQDVKKYYTFMRQAFMKRCKEILDVKHSGSTIFFNGTAEQNTPEYHALNTHFELEDLPTAWGGYDKMPPRAKFFKHTDKDYLGMTGKFHILWGEFGGFKTPEALRFECSSMVAYGARCSIGDQMHPSGEMDLDTYKFIGEAYRYIEQIEPYSFNVKETAELGIMLSNNSSTDEGLVKMLLETQMDFDIALPDEDFSCFKTIILPDCITLSKALADKLNQYVSQGGSLLLTGQSGMDISKQKFIIDFGAEYQGHSEFECDYVLPGDLLSAGIVTSPFLFYEAANIVRIREAEVLASIKEPYFNRTYEHYCSHRNTPYKLENATYPAAVKKGNVVYLAHSICAMYFENGAQYHRDYFVNALKLLYKNPRVQADLPSAGRVHLVKQEQNNRYVLHLLYAQPIQRGKVLVIEDMPVLHNIPVRLNIKEQVNSVTLIPQGIAVPFNSTGDLITFTLPTLCCHQIITIGY